MHKRKYDIRSQQGELTDPVNRTLSARPSHHTRLLPVIHPRLKWLTSLSVEMAQGLGYSL
jgi:hypothetical protein